MRKGRCKYSAFVMVRTDRRLREDAGAILRRKGTSLSAFIRDQLQGIVAQEQADARGA